MKITTIKFVILAKNYYLCDAIKNEKTMIHYFTRLQKQMKENWNGLALCDYRGEKFTFGRTAETIARFHILFEQLGIAKGEKIAICGKNQARWAVTFLAANTYEAVVVPILANFHPDNICNILNSSEAVLLFADDDIWANLDENVLKGVKTVISLKDFSPIYCSQEASEIFKNLDEAFNEKYPGGFSASDINYPTDNHQNIAVINYTSGSTGNPKGVMLRYESFSANTEFGQTLEPSTKDDNLLSILPLAHMFGMSFDMIYPLCGGTTIYFLGRTPSSSLLMKALSEIKPFHFTAVPMVYEKMYHNVIRPILNKPAIRVMMSMPGLSKLVYKNVRRAMDDAFGGKMQCYIMGGAAVNPDVEKFFRKIGLHFTVGYGMTEAGPLLAYEKWDKFALQSCGKAMAFVKLRIDSYDPRNVPGEIQAKGVNLFVGYYKNEEATKAAFTEDGWFRTGDLGIIDKKGNVFIKGRIKNMLLSSNGENIYPEEMESIINNVEFVKESLVVMRNRKLVALIDIDNDAIKKLNITEKAALAKIKKEANLKLDKQCQLSDVQIIKEPFEKTPKMSIKRYLYN